MLSCRCNPTHGMDSFLRFGLQKHRALAHDRAMSAPTATPDAESNRLFSGLGPVVLRQALLPFGIFVLDWPLSTALAAVSAEVFLGYLLATALPLILQSARRDSTAAAGGLWIRIVIGTLVVGFVASVAVMVGGLGLLGAWMMIRTLAGPGPIPLPWDAVLLIVLGLIWFAFDQVQRIRAEQNQLRPQELERVRMLETLYKVVVVANVFLFGGMFASKLGASGLRWVIPICAVGFVLVEWQIARQRAWAKYVLPMPPEPPRRRDEREDYY